MKSFAALFNAIDRTTRTKEKTAALTAYLREVPDTEKLWTVALFTGRRPRRAVTTTQLREWAAERAGLPLWLLEESYPIVGDLAETIALILPPPGRRRTCPCRIGLRSCSACTICHPRPARTRSWTRGTSWTRPNGCCSTS